MSIPGRGTISYGDCVFHLNPNESEFKDVMRLGAREVKGTKEKGGAITGNRPPRNRVTGCAVGGAHLS